MIINKTSGEVAAISGYDFQYEIFATELYNCLLNHEIDWVEFASTTAGKLDDVLIGLDNRIIAYQVKEISSSNFSYSQFTTSETESILQGAFKGWKKLKESNPGIPIDARFITTQSVSEHDSITAFKGKPKPSFEKFIRNFWTPLQIGKYCIKNLPATWAPVIKELADIVGVKPEEFILFIKDFTFVFDYRRNYYLQDTYTQTKRDNDIDRITKSIFRLVAKKGNIKFTRAQFISEFGLKNQLETHFHHSFFIDEKHYQPILDTIDSLQEVVMQKSGGYLALVGNAGSGKSTLLTKWLSDQNYKVLKYYAYTNTDMNYDCGFRGEASLFLHDLLIQIRESKISLQDRLPEKDLLDLQKHFHEELQKLSQLEQKVFIIVDGLDHIEREQQVTKSLIEVLPKPGTIPDNVYIIIGTRTIDQLGNLNFDIIEDLTDTNSIVSISPLSKECILRLTKSYGLELSSDNFDLLCINTKGHPLFLRYTLEELNSVIPDKYKSIIKRNKFSGDIYKEYQKFWNKHKDYDNFIHILGLISRFRFPYFDTVLLHLFEINNADATLVNKVAEFYFYKSDNIWQFFHNSFKEFLIEQSAKDRFSNKFDKGIDKVYHHEIAHAIKNTQNSYRYNELYHLFKAERYTDVAKLASQEYFREQWLSFRETSIILEDIKLASLSCYYQKDLKVLAGCFFSFFELEQRTRNFPIKNHYKTFLQIGRVDIANSLVFNNVRILVDYSSALEYARMLYQTGNKFLAKDLFERATPIKLLNGSSPLNTRRYSKSNYIEYDEVKLICSWAVTATFFMPLADVVGKLKQLEVENEEYDGSQRDLFTEGLSDITDFYIASKDWDILNNIADIYDNQLEVDDCFYFYFDLINAVEKNHSLYVRCLEFFNNWQLNENNKINVRYLIIFTLFENNIEKCTSILGSIKIPSIFKNELETGNINGFSNYIFNYSRLRYIITKDFSVLPESFLHLHQKPAFNTFYLAFAELGKAYALMFHNYTEASVGFFLSIDRVLNIFHHSFPEPLHEHAISNEKGVLVSLVLSVSSHISHKIFSEVLTKISNEWKNFSRFWRNSEMLQVITWVVESKLAPDWCSHELEVLDSKIFQSNYLDQRLDDGLKQVELWTLLGEQVRAEALITKIMSQSLDIRGENDYQLDNIVQWISKFETNDPNEVQFYFERLISVNNVVNSPSDTPATELLRLSLGLGNGFNAFMFLLFEGLEEFGNGFESTFAYLFKNFPKMRIVSIKLFSRIILGLDHIHGNRQYFITEFFKGKPSLDEISALIKDVELYSVLESRNDYLYGIQQQILNLGINLKSIGLHEKIERKTDSGNSENILHLKSGESYTESQLIEKVFHLDDILDLEKQADKGGYFKWHRLISKIIPITSEAAIELYLFSRDFDSLQLTEIGKILIDNNKKTLAKKILEFALSKSNSNGWVTIYDGGSKISLFEQLKRIEPKTSFQSYVFKDFAQSFTELDINSMEVLTKNLDEIFSIFSDDVNKMEIYEQIKLYRNELLKNHTLNDSEINIQGNQTNFDLSVDTLYFLITFPSSFSEIIFPILIQEQENLTDIIDKILVKLYENGFNLKFVQLIAGLAVVNSSYINQYKDKLKALLSHKRYDVASLTKHLLYENGSLDDLQDKFNLQEVPLSYTLEISPKAGITDSDQKPIEHIDDYGCLKDTEDPLIYTQLFSAEIKYLAKITGFSSYNIAYRIMLLGQDPEFPTWCTKLSEEALRSIYDDKFRFKIGYKRPQIQKVIAGLNQVVNELLQLELITERLAKEIVGRFDERIYLVETVKRPDFISPILSKSGSAPSADAKWPKGITTEYLVSVLQVETEDHFILAENTMLSAMGHGRAVETRQSFIDLDASIDVKGSMIFNFIHNCLIEEYPYQDEHGLSLYNVFATVDPKETWLAINPQLAEYMGLTYNENNGCFRWDDEHGEMVVESIFWQDGSIANQNTYRNSEAGHGWMVVITRAGMKVLLELLEGKSLFVHRKVERDMEFVQRRFNTYIKEEGSKTETQELVISVR